MISLNVTTPDAPMLTLVDLPGIVRMGRGGCILSTVNMLMGIRACILEP